MFPLQSRLRLLSRGGGGLWHGRYQQDYSVVLVLVWTPATGRTLTARSVCAFLHHGLPGGWHKQSTESFLTGKTTKFKAGVRTSRRRQDPVTFSVSYSFLGFSRLIVHLAHVLNLRRILCQVPKRQRWLRHRGIQYGTGSDKMRWALGSPRTSTGTTHHAWRFGEGCTEPGCWADTSCPGGSSPAGDAGGKAAPDTNAISLINQASDEAPMAQLWRRNDLKQPLQPHYHSHTSRPSRTLLLRKVLLQRHLPPDHNYRSVSPKLSGKYIKYFPYEYGKPILWGLSE